MKGGIVRERGKGGGVKGEMDRGRDGWREERVERRTVKGRGGWREG